MIDYTNQSDADSRLSVQTLFSQSQKFINWGTSEGNCVWDLSCMTTDGRKVSIEVKDRYNYSSTSFNDVFCEDAKQIYTNQNYDFDISFVTNVYNDNVIAIGNLNDNRATHFKCQCPKESWKGGDHTLVWKDCLGLPRLRVYKLTENGFEKV